jgi:hypothetical protein
MRYAAEQRQPRETPLWEVEAAAKPHLYHSVLGVDLQKALGVTPGIPPAVEPIPVAEPPDLGSEAETMRSELFRANPPPVPPEPEPTVAVDVVPAVPVPPTVSREVEDAASYIANQVHSSGAKPRSQVFPTSLNPADEAAYLGHALAMQWLVEEDGQVRPGPVHPQPRTTTLIPN